MATRDIKVRLTPEGVADVINALRKVQGEATQASKNAEGGVKGLRTAIGGLRSVLGTLGVVTSVAGIVAIGRSAFQSANEVMDAAKRVGASAEEYSRLSAAVRGANADLGAFEASVRVLQRNLSRALSDPSGEAARAFKQLRIEVEEFRQLPLERQLGVIADRVRSLASQEDRLRATQDLLGKSSAELLPLFLEGSAGITRMADAAQAAGKIITNEMAASIDQADKAIKRLKGTVSSFARETLAGLSILLLGPPDEIQRLDKEIDELQRRRKQVLEPLSRAGLPRSSLPSYMLKELDAVERKLDSLQKKQRALLGLDPTPRPTAAAGETVGTDRLVDIETPEQRRARLDRARARLQDAQKLAAAEQQIRAEADKRAYDQGLISAEAYYARRVALAKEAGAAEVAGLQQQIALVQQSGASTDDERARQAAQIEQLRANIELRRLETTRQLAAIAGEQTEEAKRLAGEQVEVANRLDEFEGRRHEVFQRNLQEEIRELQRLGQQAGLTGEQIAQQAQRLTGALTAQFNFDEVRRAGEAQLDAFNRDAEQIRRDQEAGLTTQLEGENRLIELERQRLEVLRELAAQMTAAALATGNPEVIAQAERFAASVGQIAASFHAATNTAARYRQGLEDGLQSAFVNIATNIDQIHSLEDAFRSLVRTVAQAMAQIAAEILAKQAVIAILRALGGAGGSTPPVGTGAQGGPVKGMASGGEVRGKSLPIPGPDTIPALLQEGEYVVRRRVAQDPVIARWLHGINTGAITRDMLNLVPRVPRFAAGGPVSLAAIEGGLAASRVAGSAARLEGVLGIEEGVVFKHLNSDGFDDLQVYRMSRNPARFRSALGL